MGGQRYEKARQLVDKDKTYSLEDAVERIQVFETANFNETVELLALLNIDPSESGQTMRGSVSLPNGIGKERTVLCFAEGEDADDAERAGAEYVGGQELAERIEEEEFFDYDVALAGEYAMRYVGPIGQLLGPKGLMPSPKDGTVVAEGDFEQAVTEFKSGRVEYRTDEGGNIHLPVGKEDFDPDDLVENIEFFLNHLRANRPTGVSGRLFQKCYLSKTMSPSVRFSPA
jgi:large subunit ribosomal protein L1